MPVSGAMGILPTASYLLESKVGKPKLASSQLPVTLKLFNFFWMFSFFPTLNNTIPTCRQLLGPSPISALQHVAGVKLGYGKKEMEGTDRACGGGGKKRRKGEEEYLEKGQEGTNRRL